jgi:hypothetical protein
MIQTQVYTEKVTAGNSQSIAALEAADTGHTYSIHSIIFLGAYDDVTVLTVNGTQLDLPGAFVLNQYPINSVSVATSPHGVLLVGKKTKKQLFTFG